MQNKSKSRTDVQWIISSISIAVSLGLWGLLASAEKRTAGVSGQVTFVSSPTDQQVVVTQPAPMLLPGQVLLFGGTAPQTSQTVVTTTSGGTTRRHSGGGSPPPSTGSSKHP